MKRIAVLLVGLAALSACGGGGGTKNTEPSSTTHSPAKRSASRSTSSTATVNPPRDTARAKAAVLELSDLPAGWLARPHEPSGTAISVSIAACLGVAVRFVNTDLVPHADADDFFSPTNGVIQSGVAIYPTVREGRAALTANAGADTPKCAQSAYEQDLRATGGGSVAVEQISSASVGEGSAAFRVTMRPARRATTYVDVRFARRGRAIASLIAASSSTPDPTLGVALLKTMDARLSRLLA